MTREVMRAEGLTKNDVGDRDRAFGMERRHQEEIFLDDAVEDVAYKSGEYRAFEQGEGGLGLPGPEEPKHGVEIEQLAVSNSPGCYVILGRSDTVFLSFVG